jgi:hypothetical protein
LCPLFCVSEIPGSIERARARAASIFCASLSAGAPSGAESVMPYRSRYAATVSS